MRYAIFAASFALALAACSGSQETATPADTGPALTIDAPPSGPLSRTQLEAVAADIRQLEANPLAVGGDQARRYLTTWIQGSPDITLVLCQGVVGPFVDSESRFHLELFGQFILSSAATMIETPEADQAAINLGGLEGTLAAYTVMKRQMGARARDPFMESVAEQAENGTLDSFVRAGLADC